eukprot:6060000-Pleurochrysis_carterae.AAC.1
MSRRQTANAILGSTWDKRSVFTSGYVCMRANIARTLSRKLACGGERDGEQTGGKARSKDGGSA